MRDIKFRGKTEVSGKWSYGNLCIRIDGAMIITPDETLLGTYGKVDRNTVGQYTGLKDKNGTEIYEGDIVTNGDESIIYVVEWIDTGLKARQTGNKSYIGLNAWKGTLEVIGNIYDNPELLGE